MENTRASGYTKSTTSREPRRKGRKQAMKSILKKIRIRHDRKINHPEPREERDVYIAMGSMITGALYGGRGAR